MKKVLILVSLLLSIFVTGCEKTEKQILDIQPQEAQMKAICELATLDCYYHNIAKHFEKDAEGALWWKKDRNFWIEYSGVVTIGIETSKIKIEVDDTNVKITLPPATVMGFKVDNDAPTNVVIDKESAKVEAEHLTGTYKEAQEKMQKTAREDKVLLENARQRAKSLLEDYVNNIGNCVGKEYNIQWIYLEDEIHTTEVSEPVTTE
ncbi:MAG: DUF4230 domain-containing protein [Ruminococcus sp.]|nr:DUF4230 domain-containing protein [Ruminococcus sp.]